MTENADMLEAALARVAGAAGRIAAPGIAGGAARLVLDVTGLDGAARAALAAEIEAAARTVPGVDAVRIAMTEEKPRRRVIAVASGKGGVGKSTVAANLAVALARLGERVGLVDADIYGPSQARIMGEAGKPEVADKILVPRRAHGVSLLSFAQLVAPDMAVAWRGPMVAGAFANLMDADWGDAGWLVVDLPPGTGDVQMSLAQKWKPAGAVIVSTPQDLALIDARRAIDFFAKTGVPVLGLVENMSGFACPHCGKVSDPFGAGGAQAEARALGIPFLGRIPLRMAIRAASDAGSPPAAGEGEEAALFRDLAVRVRAALDPEAG